MDDKRIEIRSPAQATDFSLSTETTPHSKAHSYPYPTVTEASVGKLDHKPSNTAEVYSGSVPPLPNTSSHMTTRSSTIMCRVFWWIFTSVSGAHAASIFRVQCICGVGLLSTLTVLNAKCKREWPPKYTARLNYSNTHNTRQN